MFPIVTTGELNTLVDKKMLTFERSVHCQCHDKLYYNRSSLEISIYVTKVFNI